MIAQKGEKLLAMKRGGREEIVVNDIKETSVKSKN